MILILMKNVLICAKNVKKIKTFDFSYFLIKVAFGDDGFQSKFFYQPKFNMLELKDKDTEYIIV